MEQFKTIEIKVIGAFFLVGGLFGFYTFLGIIFPLNNLISFLNIFPTILFGLALYSGYLLLIKEDEKGLEIGRAVDALQILKFTIVGVSYVFITGAYVFVGFTNIDFGLNFGLDNTFHIGLMDETDFLELRVNILALSAFIYLTKLLKRLDDGREMMTEETNN